ncbi:hypothetical protein GCM10010446_55630 [Streptomyces enissocaesilis]|uniref:Uncharacterized protein n=1 Tax=Streptomyces enissocaesilis TaxID=332589 RepID=A0ABN3XKR9_9ACTN
MAPGTAVSAPNRTPGRCGSRCGAKGVEADRPRAAPGGTASWQDYVPVPVGEGAHVHGVRTSVPDSGPGAHPTGVGGDGRTVTPAQGARVGDPSDAPVPALRRTTRTAVAKPY